MFFVIGDARLDWLRGASRNTKLNLFMRARVWKAPTNHRVDDQRRRRILIFCLCVLEFWNQNYERQNILSWAINKFMWCVPYSPMANRHPNYLVFIFIIAECQTNQKWYYYSIKCRTDMRALDRFSRGEIIIWWFYPKIYCIKALVSSIEAFSLSFIEV